MRLTKNCFPTKPLRNLAVCISLALSSSMTIAQQSNEQFDRRAQQEKSNAVSPARNINRGRPSEPQAPVFDIRSYDGSNNNLEHTEMGAAHTHLTRYT